MKDSGNHHKSGWVLAGTTLYIATVFVIDLMTNTLDVWVLYLPLIPVLVRLNALRQITGTAIACAVLMTVDTFLAYREFGFPFILANLVLRIVALWLVALGGVIIANNVIRRKELERGVLEAAANEQQRIGQELHDSVGQELTGLGLMANALAQRLQSDKTDSQIVDRLVDGLIRLQQHIRTLSHGLAPVPIEANGLWAALEALATDTTETSGIPVQFHSPQHAEVSNHTAATHLYRIAQEAVNNALRHGHPQHINLTLLDTGNGLCLSVEDDGIGIQYPLVERAGMGLRIMQYRAEQIGGVLKLRRRETGGTAVTCTLTPNIWEGAGHDESEVDALACENLNC